MGHCQISLWLGQHTKGHSFTGLSELFLVGGCVKKVGGCDELKTEQDYKAAYALDFAFELTQN